MVKLYDGRPTQEPAGRPASARPVDDPAVAVRTGYDAPCPRQCAEVWKVRRASARCAGAAGCAGDLAGAGGLTAPNVAASGVRGRPIGAGTGRIGTLSAASA